MHKIIDLYEKPHILQVAWSVASSTRVSSRMGNIAYDRVLVNLGNAWNPSTNTVTIPQTGFYFLHIGAGVYPEQQALIYLYVNNIRQFSLLHHSRNHNGVDTRSRSGILHLSSGAQLRTGFGSYDLYSDSGLQTIFIGFLLY